jgi:coenzyme F420-reducing hydrogenase beta subunit
MTFNPEGFAYPQVDETICNACRKCVQSCPGFNDIDRENATPEPRFFAGHHEADHTRMKSSSGGLFTAFAENILSKGGTVYGAVYDFDRMAVHHSRASSLKDIDPMRKSKYVQSDTTRVFKKVKQDLRFGLPVLFTGTPCQVAGLHLYLKGQEEKLFTIDLVCHGVPSPGLFAAHFSWLEEKRQAPITNIDFRTKDKGWGSFLNFYLKVSTKDRAWLTYAPLDAYYVLFLANLSLRPVCYQCKFASQERVADITLGDYWGVQKDHPDLFDGKGTSLILANTQKGEKLLLELQQSLTLKPLSAVHPLPPNLVRPTPKPILRDGFLKSIRFDRWGKQRARVHLLALSVLGINKFLQGLKRIFNLNS